MKYVKLGDYIEECNERNEDNKYSVDYVKGISIEKKFIETKADMENVPLKNYKIVKTNEFGYVTVTSRNGEKISLAINNDNYDYIVSSTYIVFKTNQIYLLPKYLYLFFNRNEFNRYTRFNSYGSAREVFSFEDMKNVKISLPSIQQQQKIINIYYNLKKIKEDNEKLVEKLTPLCNSYLQECKHKYNFVELGEYIEERNERNVNNEYGVENLKGVSNKSCFDDFKANITELDFSKYKIVRQNDFCFNPSAIKLGSIALNDIYIYIYIYIYMFSNVYYI